MRSDHGQIDRGLDSFAMRSFRDIADQDYITARLCYRSDLMLQFYWSALQAIEKYFKAILLFNRIESLHDGHDLEALYSKVLQIDMIELILTERQQQFLERVNQSGKNRYMTLPFQFEEYELVELDNFIWTVRGFCRAEASNQFPEAKRKETIASIKSSILNQEHVTLPGGYIERTLSDKSSEQRPALIWNNLYFGRKRKSVKMRSSWGETIPPQVLNPEILDALLKLVRFPEDERKVLIRYRDNLRRERKSKKR